MKILGERGYSFTTSAEREIVVVFTKHVALKIYQPLIACIGYDIVEDLSITLIPLCTKYIF